LVNWPLSTLLSVSGKPVWGGALVKRGLIDGLEHALVHTQVGVHEWRADAEYATATGS